MRQRILGNRLAAQAFQTKLFIDNKFVESSDGKTLPTINPATEETITNIHMASADDINTAVAAARRAFATWRLTNGTTRRDLMLNLANLIKNNAEELAAIESLDSGKPYLEALNADVAEVVRCITYFAGWADKITGEVCSVNRSNEAVLSYTKHEPVGVAGLIVPWNYPLLMATWKLAPALACGCTIVLKPSEFTSLSILRLAELFVEAGFPAGVVNIVPGLGSVAGAALSKHPQVAKVSFTGSIATGRALLAASSDSNLKRITLELGGKSPLIIHEDANLDLACQVVTDAIFGNCGQVCTASSRCFVHERVYDEVVARIGEIARKRVVGDGGDDESIQMGPLVSRQQYDRVLSFINGAPKEGAQCLAGHLIEADAARLPKKGYFVAPTIFTNVDDQSTIAQNEVFGPVLSVLKPFKSLQEAIERANSTHYGLGASIFTKDIKSALTFARDIESGSVWINCHDVADNGQPFGGVKLSGFGRDLGRYALDQYTNAKAVMVNYDY